MVAVGIAVITDILWCDMSVLRCGGRRYYNSSTCLCCDYGCVNWLCFQFYERIVIEQCQHVFYFLCVYVFSCIFLSFNYSQSLFGKFNKQNPNENFAPDNVSRLTTFTTRCTHPSSLPAVNLFNQPLRLEPKISR